MYMCKEFEDAKGQTEIFESENRQDHGQQNETKDKHRTQNTTLKCKAMSFLINLTVLIFCRFT